MRILQFIEMSYKRIIRIIFMYIGMVWQKWINLKEAIVLGLILLSVKKKTHIIPI